METVNANGNGGKNSWDSLRSPAAPEDKTSPSDVILRALKIGNASLRVGEAGPKDIKGPEYNPSDVASYKHEEIKNYREDQYDSNIDFLHKHNADQSIQTTYSQLMRQYPQLRNVALGNYDGQNAFFNGAVRIDGEVKPRVSFNFDNPDIYLTEKYNDKGEMRGFYYVIAEIALRTGARPKDIASNRALITSFLIAHEFGHAMDFNENFLNPAIYEARKTQSSGVGMVALPKAISKNVDSRMRDMSAGLQGGLEFGDATTKTGALATRLRDLDIRDNSEFLATHSKFYRTCRSESIADGFAMNFVMQNYNRFFYDPLKNEPARGRVPTNAHGETRRVDEKIIPFLDFHAGKHIDLSVSTPDMKGMEQYDCYLETSLRSNQELIINTSGDPTKHETDVKKFPKVLSVRIRQDFVKGAVKNSFYLVLADGRVAKLETKGDGSAPSINVDPDEFIKRYQLEEGSKISLLKRATRQGKSSVNTGGVISGALTKNQSGKLIGLNDSIYLGKDAKPGFSGGNTSKIRRVYRKWKKYFVDTETSTYELLPYFEGKK